MKLEWYYASHMLSEMGRGFRETGFSSAQCYFSYGNGISWPWIVDFRFVIGWCTIVCSDPTFHSHKSLIISVQTL